MVLVLPYSLSIRVLDCLLYIARQHNVLVNGPTLQVGAHLGLIALKTDKHEFKASIMVYTEFKTASSSKKVT